MPNPFVSPEVSLNVPDVRFLVQGEGGLVVDFGDVIDEAVNTRVRVLAALLAERSLTGVVESVPTFRSLFICFDPLIVTRQKLTEEILRLLPATASFEDAACQVRRVLDIPVCYGGAFGPDLGYVAEHNGLRPEEVAALHAEPVYLVYMLGFTPGFPYLGGMSERIAAPRIEKPRLEIPAGSVGIAGCQTGIYPVASPGGWRIIGRTPLRIFDPLAPEPFMIAPGDCLRFVPIGQDDFEAISRDVEAGVYKLKTHLSHPAEERA